jgi:murein DD-endopeptidase MepM/ murein hydrolase activator NlpD
MHAGSDISAARHTIIRAAASGTVSRVRCNAIDRRTGRDWGCDRDGHPDHTAGCGWYLDLAHPGGITTRYCHLQTEPWVKPGEVVLAGQPIGTVGSTGHSSGPHLHYEVHMRREAPNNRTEVNEPVDPAAFHAQVGAPLGAA